MAEISFSIWSVIILLGAGQGLFLSFYLFAKNENRDANKWLALLVLVVSLHLLEYAADISGVTLYYPFLIAITYPLLFCMGPFYYFYCRNLLHQNKEPSFNTILHFIPSLGVLLFMLPFYMMTETEKIAYILGLSSGEAIIIPTGQLVFMGVHVLQTIIYVSISYKFISKKEENIKRVSSDVITVKKLNWLKSFSFSFSVYLTLYLALVIVLSFASSFQIEIDYLMLLITSISIYVIGYAAAVNPEIHKTSIVIEAIVSGDKSNTLIRNGNKLPELKVLLLNYMETHKPYLKNELKISELADEINIPYYQLSQLINDEFSVNFYDFINKYRVEEAKKLLIEDKRNYKILALAYETGFNSKATFNRVFKNHTGLTPSEFRKKYSNSGTLL